MSTNAEPTTSGLTDAERAMLLDGQEHTVEADCWSASCAGSLPWAVARIKADARVDARAEERAGLTAAVLREREGYLASDSLDPAWIAGWHSAVDWAVYQLLKAADQ